MFTQSHIVEVSFRIEGEIHERTLAVFIGSKEKCFKITIELQKLSKTELFDLMKVNSERISDWWIATVERMVIEWKQKPN